MIYIYKDYEVKKFDGYVPWIDHSNPYMESGIVGGIRDYVVSGDSVIVLGGGYGVSAVAAARAVGQNGRVTVYEAAKSEVQRTIETLELNDVKDRVELVHAAVGEPGKLRGKLKDGDIIEPGNLPQADVLQIDVDGAEGEILSSLEITPRCVIVETHKFLDWSKKEIADILDESDYSVIEKRIADESMVQYCKDNGIWTLIAKYQDYCASGHTERSDR